MWTNRYSGDDSELPAKKTMFETNILKFFFLKGHLLLILVVLQIKIQSTLSKTETFGTGTKCLSYRESNKGSKERQGPTLGVRFTEVSIL